MTTPVIGSSRSTHVGAYCASVSGARVLADEYWAYYRDTAQLWNIDRGDVDEIERWEDLSGPGVAERVRRLGEFGERARTMYGR